jgi:hypothetical protein
MGTRVLFPGVKHGRGMMLTTHPRLVPRLRMSRSYTSSPPGAFMHVTGHLYLFLLFRIRSSDLFVQDLNCQARKNFEAGFLSRSELEKTLEGQKKMFPKGIEECGADALRFTLCSANIKSMYRYSKETHEAKFPFNVFHFKIFLH